MQSAAYVPTQKGEKALSWLWMGSGVGLGVYVIILILKWSGVFKIPPTYGMFTKVKSNRAPTRYYIRVVSKSDTELFYLEKLTNVKCVFEPVIKVNETEFRSTDYGIHMAVFLNGKKTFTRSYNTHNNSEEGTLFYNTLSDVAQKGSENDLLIIQTLNGVGNLKAVGSSLRQLGLVDRIPLGAEKNDPVMPYVLVYDLKNGKVIFEKSAPTSVCVVYEDKINI